jgi:hypothetical protein
MAPDLGYHPTGTLFGGDPLYRCDLCAFDSTSTKAMDTHIAEDHTAPIETPVEHASRLASEAVQVLVALLRQRAKDELSADKYADAQQSLNDAADLSQLAQMLKEHGNIQTRSEASTD